MIRRLKDKKFRKKLKLDLRKKSQQVKEMVPESVVEKAVQFNPLTPPEIPAISDSVEPITNESIAEHREEVLSGARKYIYPLQHSKHRILVISSFITTAVVVAFLAYCGLGMYRFYHYNTFLYRVTQVVPFPIARADGHFVSYEDYLFELRHYLHYYQTQLDRDFSGDDKQQLLTFRKQALADTINNSYVKTLARQNHVSVSNKEVNQRISEVRNQNRLGSNDKVFADVLHDYWGWSVNDFKRSLKDQILNEKVAAKLDVAATARANSVLAQLASDSKFADLAKKVSDASDKTKGGEYGFSISRSNPNVPPQVVTELFNLNPGQTSGIINAGATLEIVKLISKSGDRVTASHISINLEDISIYIKALQAKNRITTYVHF